MNNAPLSPLEQASAKAPEADRTHSCTVVGLGLRALAHPAALQALWQQAQADLQGQTATAHFCAVAVLDTKTDHTALATWLAEFAGKTPSIPVLAVPAARLAEQAVPTQSPRLLARYGSGSVAEAAALSAAGPQAQLIVPRIVAADGSATLAVAIRRAGYPKDCLAAAGRARAAAPLQGTTT